MKRLSRNPLSAVGRSQSSAWVRRSHLEDYEPPRHSLTLEPPRHSVSLEAPFHSLPLEPPFHSLPLEPPRPSFFTQTRRTESKSGILGHFRALFSSHNGGACHRKDKHTHEPTNEERNMLQKVKEIRARDELKISNVVKSNGRNYWNKNTLEEPESTRYYIEDHGTQQPPRHSLSSRYIENYSSGWQPTDQIEEVEPPQSLTSPLHYGLPGWQPTEIEEVEPPPYLTWQPTQIEEVEPPQSLTWRPTQIKEVEAPHYLTWQPTQIEEAPHSLTSPPHTLTSRTRRPDQA
uniref:Uncharacterized protein n=1 Tax=Fagus sylvatica TaxID=28930 RepID=A0A2N9G814_FAGSY